jgi:hypothetical protein
MPRTWAGSLVKVKRKVVPVLNEAVQLHAYDFQSSFSRLLFFQTYKLTFNFAFVLYGYEIWTVTLREEENTRWGYITREGNVGVRRGRRFKLDRKWRVGKWIRGKERGLQFRILCTQIQRYFATGGQSLSKSVNLSSWCWAPLGLMTTSWL